MEYHRLSYLSLPEDPGVYQFLNSNGIVLYVGKAKNLKKRVSSYFIKRGDVGDKTRLLVSQINNIKITKVATELEALLLEANLIKKFNPKYNARLTDDKSYIRIRITIKDQFPKVLLARREDDRNSLYFGPFPSSNDVKFVLKFIRKIFPYQSVTNHQKRFCLYYHIGLCPCPPMFSTTGEKWEYKKTIRLIVKFLNGENKQIIKELEKERNKESKNERFENALKIQKKIDSINSVITKKNNPFDYETNPNLLSDIRTTELKDLINVLVDNNVKIKKLERIECYDISNISGTNAVGSMVVFTKGNKNTSEYKRFKIKNPPSVVPNDFAMIYEVLSRRTKHKEWGKPDLIIIDGGKGQVSSAQKVLSDKTLKIPIIGIAKKEELLIMPDFSIVRLKKNSPALNLVKRIRDEAHRFAIAYHKKIRSGKMFI